MTLKSVPQWLTDHQDQVTDTPIYRVTKEELLELLKNDEPGLAIIDIRNEQEDKGVIKKALHIPATVVDGPSGINEHFLEPVLDWQPQTKKIVLYCNSSGKRTTYIGGWAKDYLASIDRQDLEVVILDEGITGWVKGGDEFKDETLYYPTE
ncbi:hypothetical protein PUMCH_002865 [Australozyma saopauloensis]|uniref:Rhodanese domain-containing protein n=1 Tax=Australozyma saopauloensis TaxID=291208 RepID=A0AAX4HCY6_9ASCO|nr:hypothetical protein PUMCH_002865 [[Candida] saopauloensis]